jgi:hypothetical protein
VVDRFVGIKEVEESGLVEGDKSFENIVLVNLGGVEGRSIFVPELIFEFFWLVPSFEPGIDAGN